MASPEQLAVRSEAPWLGVRRSACRLVFVVLSQETAASLVSWGDSGGASIFRRVSGVLGTSCSVAGLFRVRLSGVCSSIGVFT